MAKSSRGLTIPDRGQLYRALINIAREAYPGQPGWAPIYSDYNIYRSPEYCTAQAIVRSRGIKFSPEGWRRAVKEMTGLHVPTASEAWNHKFQMRKEAEEKDIYDSIVNSRAAREYRKERDRATYGTGLKCLPVDKPVQAYCRRMCRWVTYQPEQIVRLR